MKRAGNMHRVSLGGRYGRPRGKRLREASRYRRNATLFDYGVTQDRTTMNTPRRLCGTMPPTHVSHPPTSFMSMWFSRTSDLRISAAKSPSRHRLHILEHVWVRPHEHACWYSLGRTTGSCVQIMHADMRANMMGPCARFLLCAVAAQKRGFFVRFPTGLGAQALKARSLTSAVGGFCAHCRYCNLVLSGMHYIVKAV